MYIAQLHFRRNIVSRSALFFVSQPDGVHHDDKFRFNDSGIRNQHNLFGRKHGNKCYSH